MRPDDPAAAENRNPARVFGEVASEYDRVRPAFPDELADDVLRYSSAALDGRRALEVGAGTGRATALIASRGVPVVAVEPDEAMADVLAGRVFKLRRVAELGRVTEVRRGAELPGVEVVRAGFEEFRPAERFGLLFSAEAWHWTTPASRWGLAAAALADGGTVALFWDNERIDDEDLRVAWRRTMDACVPPIVIPDDPMTAENAWSGELARHPEFGDRESRRYRRRRSMPRADYLSLTQTRSQFRTLPPPARRDLLATLTDLFDDQVPLIIETELMLLRVRRPGR